MKTIRTVTTVVTADGLQLQWACPEGEAPTIVHLTTGPNEVVSLHAELLERAAQVLEDARRRASKANLGLCVEHGYYEETEATRYYCPRCVTGKETPL